MDSREIIVYTTDKSAKFCVASVESYTRQGAKHTCNDEVISWEEFAKIQRILKCHTRASNSIFNCGQDLGETEESRTRNAREMVSTTVPVLSLLAKDHKGLEENGDPKSRPVCGAHKSPNGELSELLSDIVESAVQADGQSKESISRSLRKLDS